jgi:hypothetical protein
VVSEEISDLTEIALERPLLLESDYRMRSLVDRGAANPGSYSHQ